MAKTEEEKREYQRLWKRQWRKLPHAIAAAKEYSKRPEVLERDKEYHNYYNKTPKGQAIRANQRAKWAMDIEETDITTEFLLELWDKTIVCEFCNKEIGLERSLDHIVPINVGGKHERINVRWIHRVCNSKRPKDGRDAYFRIPTI